MSIFSRNSKTRLPLGNFKREILKKTIVVGFQFRSVFRNTLSTFPGGVGRWLSRASSAPAQSVRKTSKLLSDAYIWACVRRRQTFGFGNVDDKLTLRITVRNEQSASTFRPTAPRGGGSSENYVGAYRRISVGQYAYDPTQYEFQNRVRISRDTVTSYRPNGIISSR